MADEPMDEDDSFYQPVPCSVPLNRQGMTQASQENGNSDPESDDSFETFAPTQSTGESGRSSGSAPSAESKGPLPPPVSNQPHADPNIQRNAFKPSVASAQFSQLSTQRVGNPMAPAPTVSRFPAPSQPHIPTQITTQTGIGMHASVTNTRVSTLTQASSTSSSSPNSLARHRSANSGLRNSQVNTPPMRAGTMLTVRRTPPDIRPSTPIGENKMLKDQLDYEKQKNQKLQSDFQKDTQKNLMRHKKEITDRDEIIKKQEKEIEMLKTANACRKPSGSPVIVKSAPTPTVPTCSEVKRVYPKIPAESGNVRRTPRRGVHFPQPISAFRHSAKEEDDDTFQLDVSFEPSATSTPKIPPVPRAGIRRPFDVSERVDVAFGAPTPKRKPIFQPERQRRSRDELDKELQEMWRKADDGGTTSSCFFKESRIEEDKNADRMEVEDEENEWIEGFLCRQIRSLDFRKSNEKVTAKTRTKILNQAEQKPIQEPRCACCGIDAKIREKDGASCSEKEWESAEKQKMDREKRGAEELRALQYSTMMQNISRRGIEELEGSNQQKKQMEQEYELKLGRIRKRSLDEIRAEKKEVWRTAIMEELREKGEMNAVLKVRESGRNEDYIWTSDSDDEDWMFPAPYDLNKRVLCCDCAHQQRMMRRISKREREKRRLEAMCLQEYGVEQRELLRNMSILTKSKMEAADNELNRHVDEMLASRLFDDEDEDEDIF